MNANILNRAAAIVPDKQLLVNIVRLRVRQLVAGHRPLIQVPPGMGLSDVALSEVADGKLTSASTTEAAGDSVAAAPIITFPAAPVGKKKAA